jgi:hypothetical protein
MANNFPVLDANGVSRTVKAIDNTSVFLPCHAIFDSTGSNAAAVSASNALKVDGSAVTQPVSGTVTASISGTVAATQSGTWNIGTVTSVALNSDVRQGTAANLNATVVGAGSAGTANAGVLTIQGIASMTPVQVSQATASNLNAAVVGTGTAGSPAGNILTVQGVASMTPVYDIIRDAAGNARGANVNASNQLSVSVDNSNVSTNIAQVAGASVQTGHGTASGAIRVELPTDGTGFVNAIVPFVTLTTQFTRPNDTNTYTANDAMADSTSAPTSGGFTITGAGRASGGSGIITDATIGMSTNAALSLQGEVWIFDSSVTAVNDADPFSLSDADRDKLVGIIPFSTTSGATNNASAWVTGLAMGFTCVGTANLRFLVKVINAYVPAAQEVFTLRVKIQQLT